MSRVKRGVTSKKRHKKILKQARGYYGARSKVFRVAKQAVIKSHQYAYRDRRQKKRTVRRMWIVSINAAVRKYNMSYSKFIFNLKTFNIKVNRKILFELILKNENSLKYIMEKFKNISDIHGTKEHN